MGVLHTSSYYAKENIDDNFQARTAIQQLGSLNSLKAQEDKLYKAFGVNSYEEFISKIREHFLDTDDAKVIQRFTPESLAKSLDKFKGGQGELFNENVIFSLDTSQMDTKIFDVKALLNFTGAGNVKVVGVKGDDLQVSLNFNHKEVKDFFNVMYKDRHFLPERTTMIAVLKDTKSWLSFQVKNVYLYT